MSFATLLSEAIAAEGLPSTGDVLSVGLPLLRQIDELHHQGEVTRLRGTTMITYDGSTVRLDPGARQPPRRHDRLIARLDPERPASGVEIANRLDVDLGVGHSRTLTSLDVFDGEAGERPDRPMFTVGYQAWEQFHDHHDELTDIHLAGQLLASYALGLDLDLPAAVNELAVRHRHLLTLNPNLHPVVAGVLTDMLEPDRHRRPGTLGEAIAKLEHHRELPTDLDLAPAYRAASGWQRAVLSTLRERVFDVSRRNRALYFRPTASSVSLTEASVPLLLDVNRIKPDDLLTWTGSAADNLRAGKAVDLEQWCRFEEAPHLAPSLDTLISNERKLRAEHGQGRLQLIAAFLRWVDPDTGDAVSSPLLVAPAELTRKRGVRDRYKLQIADELRVNPVLRHVFGSRFDVVLPERIDGDVTSIRALVDQLEAAVQATDPSVRIELVETPRISLIKRRAQLRVDAYRRRRAQAAVTQGRWRRQDHSYDHDDWRPLGLALYRRFVRPAELPLRALTDAKPPPRPPSAMAPSATREQTGYAVGSGDVNRHRWEVDLCAVTLATLGSRRTNLARDYDSVLTGEGDAHAATLESFEAIFSPEPRPVVAGDRAPLDVDQTLVLPADDAQARAVRRAVAGASFIIQGPPGTGKSQTITNLIAALVADGKRVLFVCEKRAALDVVAHRLRQVGLGELAAIIHDSQLDRKDFIADLGTTYERWLAMGDDDRETARTRAFAAVRELLDPLERTFAELTDARGDRSALASVVERLVGLRARGVTAAPQVPADVTERSWTASRPTIDRVVSTMRSAGHQGGLWTHPLLRVAPGAVASAADPVVAVRELGAELSAAAREFTAALGDGGEPAAVTIESLRRLHAGAASIRTVGRHGAVGVFDRASGAYLDLRDSYSSLQQMESAAAVLEPVTERWSNPLSADDARAALTVAHDKEQSAFKFLSGTWRKVRDLVRSSYRFDLHQIEPTVAHVLGELVAWHDAREAVERRRTELTARYGTGDLRALLDTIEAVGDDPVALAVAHGRVDSTMLAAAAERLGAIVDQLVLADVVTLPSLQGLATELERASVADEGTLLAWAELADAPPAVVSAALEPSGGPDEIERALLERVVEQVGGSAVGLSGARLDETVDRLLDRYRELLAANAGMVAARVRDRFVEHVEFSEASMAGRSDEDKAFKRSYNAGRKLLEREFQKKMRFRSIRELAGGDSGAVVRDLKPVWLMSPLSVSDTLPLDDESFDVVVFDEASQIPVEDAVPSLMRAAQVVVVGDRMQLPPTRFFAAELDDDDDEVAVVDEDGHRMAVTLDADSFLTQADLALPSSMLTWHYRSRSEALIAYSNHAFYDARLATVPDRAFDSEARAEIVVDSPEDARTNVAELLARPISFHKVEHGVYEQRRNEMEADYIAELVRALLVSDSDLTIGIVAFSEAQQGAIESSLAELSTVDHSFAELLEAEQERVDDGEFVGLFVKNLENVQGDERDVIIMSVCYARGPSGKMRMNFGPINQAGGERRLNVIFSRAKRHMAIVSTITGQAITNTHNDGAAHLARFLTYAEAESRGGAGGDGVLRSLRPGESAVDAARRSAVAADLAGRLRDRGREVDTDVGRSVFTVDVAIRGDDGYVLGVMIDPGPDESSAASRAIAEAGVLDAFGWPVTRVLITEWWTSPDDVLDRLSELPRTTSGPAS